MRKSSKLRNIDIEPNTLVPANIRIEVYKEAMKIIKKGEPAHGITFFSLCVLLPSILWNLKYYIDDAPCGHGWFSGSTPVMFPELTDERINEITDISWEHESMHIKKRNLKRLAMLREMIADLTSKENEERKY